MSYHGAVLSASYIYGIRSSESFFDLYDSLLTAELILSFVWFLLFLGFSGIYLEKNRCELEEVNQTGYCYITYVIVLTLIIFFPNLFFPKAVWFFYCFYILALFPAHFLLYKIKILLLNRKSIGYRTIIIGSKNAAKLLLKRLRASFGKSFSVDLLGVVDDTDEQKDFWNELFLGRLDEIEEIMERLDVEEIFITHTGIGRNRLYRILELAEEKNIQIYSTVLGLDLIFKESDLYELGGITILSLNEDKLHPLNFYVKRLFDIVVSSLLLVILSPFFLLIAFLIKLDSKGPVFFSQIRIGQRKKPFMMYKFRTMKPDAENILKELIDVENLKDPVFKIKNDPRVSLFGKWLRKYSLDELPQLLNVLKGEMSLVGPRPEERQIVSRYNEWQRRRLKAVPGITGYQQVMARHSTDLDERLAYDVTYIRYRSIWSDLHILFKTLWVVGKGQ